MKVKGQHCLYVVLTKCILLRSNVFGIDIHNAVYYEKNNTYLRNEEPSINCKEVCVFSSLFLLLRLCFSFSLIFFFFFFTSEKFYRKNMFILFQWVQLRWKVIFSFADIGGSDDFYCFFLIKSRYLDPAIYHKKCKIWRKKYWFVYCVKKKPKEFWRMIKL